jgi:hypothetical protein
MQIWTQLFKIKYPTWGQFYNIFMNSKTLSLVLKLCPLPCIPTFPKVGDCISNKFYNKWKLGIVNVWNSTTN